VDFKQLDRGEMIAALGGLLLVLSIFLAWYSLGNSYAALNSCHGPNTACSGWHSLTILRFVLILAALAPAVLAYIIVRGAALSWPRGELTAVVALVALTFIIFRGVIDKPGSPSGQISIDYGWWVALLGGALILFGSIWRSRESGGARRKPPGVL
jgi:ribose/xylose/arabinose/galactoside ABC-type transport system permease subunit